MCWVCAQLSSLSLFTGTVIWEVKFPSSHLSFAELAIPDQLGSGVLSVCQLLIFYFYSKATKVHRRAGRREEPRGGLEKQEVFRHKAGDRQEGDCG